MLVLGDEVVGPFIGKILYDVLKNGYVFQEPQYPPSGKCGVAIFVPGMTDRKWLLIDAAMRIIDIKFSRECGLTWLITAKHDIQIQLIKELLVKASGVEPDEDTNFSCGKVMKCERKE